MNAFDESINAAVSFFWRELGVAAQSSDGKLLVPTAEDGTFRWRAPSVPPRGEPQILTPHVVPGANLDPNALMVFIRRGEEIYKGLRLTGEP